MIHLKIKKHQKDFSELYFPAMIFLPSINYYLNILIQTGLGIRLSTSAVIYCYLLVLSGIAVYQNLARKKSVFLVCLLIFAGIWTSFILYPSIWDVIYGNPVDLIYNPINRVMFFCIPALLAVPGIGDYEVLYNRLVPWAKITAVLGITVYAYVGLLLGKRFEYMSFSYFFVTAISFCFENFMDQRRPASLILLLASIVTIVFCGARGAIFSLLVYMGFRWLFREGDTIARSLLRVFAVLFVGLVFLYYFRDILLAAKKLTDSLGIHSRFIDSIISESLFDSSGRNRLAQSVYLALQHNPFGYGFFGDRYAIGTYGVFGAYIYAHNFFIEILCDFGLIMGPILIVFFLFGLGRFTMSKQNIYLKRVVYALLPYGFFQLMFSSSFLENVMFYMICGMIFVKSTHAVGEKS